MGTSRPPRQAHTRWQERWRCGRLSMDARRRPQHLRPMPSPPEPSRSPPTCVCSPFRPASVQTRLCGRTFLPLPLPCLERKDHPLPREEGTFLPLHGQAPSAEPPFSPPPHPDPPSCMPSSCTIPSRRAQVRMASLNLLGALASLEWGAMDLCTSEGTLEVLLTAADVHASGAPCCRNLKSSEGPG